MSGQMPPLRKIYRDQIVVQLDTIMTDSEGQFGAARDAVVDALASDGLVHVGGSGHSHLLAEEVFYRAGGIAAAQAILDPDLMLHKGAERSTQLERVEGRAAKTLATYEMASGDVFFIASNSGRNSYPIELALSAHAVGVTTIALTCLKHSRAVTSRHSSGKRLFEVTNLVVDTHGAVGDAALPIPGRDEAMGPTSTIAGVYTLNAILAEAVATLTERGIYPDIYQSANTGSTGAQADGLIDRWRSRVRGL